MTKKEFTEITGIEPIDMFGSNWKNMLKYYGNNNSKKMKKQTDMLEKMFYLQEKLERTVEPFVTTPIDTIDSVGKQLFTLDFIGHTMEELVELRRELPIRKMWSTKRHRITNQTKVLEEYVDALHFFITIALINGWTAKDIYKAYTNKNEENHTRQKNKY